MSKTPVSDIPSNTTATSPIVVITATLIELSWGRANELTHILDQQDHPNRLTDSQLIEECSDHYWLDLSQVVQAAPDIMARLREWNFFVTPGCRITTRNRDRLQQFEQALYDGAHKGEGTSWVNLHYAVVAAQASTIYAGLVACLGAQIQIIQQPDLPLVPCSAPPLPRWMDGRTLSSRSWMGF